MTRAIAVLRPEPGNRVTAAAIEARGRRAIRLPLFEVRPLAWEPPDPARFDALLLTSANTLRHGGEGLARLRALPVHAVGSVTADAARRAGFDVVRTGDDGAATLIADARADGVARALHLGARERTIGAEDIIAEAIAVYASTPTSPETAEIAALAGTVAMIQSARAGRRLAEIVERGGIARADVAIAAISSAAAAAAGGGWGRVAVAPDAVPERLIDLAVALAD